MNDELHFFRIVLFACLEAGVLAVPSFRDPIYAIVFAGLFGVALILQWLIHDEDSLRMSDPSRFAEPAELERVFFAGNELETEVEVTAENATLRDALGGAQQIKVRLGMVAVFGLFLFVVFRGHVTVETTMLFPVLAALAIVPAMSLNHFIPPLAAATFGVLAAALKSPDRYADADPLPTADFVYRALFVFFLILAIWAYRRVELSLRETEFAPATRIRRNWRLPAQAAAVFLMVWFALNALLPRFEAKPKPPSASAPPISMSRMETQTLQYLAKQMMRPPQPGADSQAGAGTALAGLNPAEVSAALALAQAMSRYTPPIGHSGEAKGSATSPNSPQAKDSPDAPFPVGGVPVNRQQAEALLQKMANMANGTPGATTPTLPTNEADFRRTLAAAKELARGISGAEPAVEAPTPHEGSQAIGNRIASPAGSPGGEVPALGSLSGSGQPAEKAPANPGVNRATAPGGKLVNPSDHQALPFQAKAPETLDKFRRFLERLGRLVLTLAIAGLVFVFLRKLLMAPRSADDRKKRRAPRRLRRMIHTELSRINRATLSPRQEVLERYQLFLRAAALRGTPREEWYPPTDFDERLGQAFPPVAKNAHVITDIFCETTYADRPPDTARLGTFRTACTEAIQALLS